MNDFVPDSFWLIESVKHGKRNVIGVFDQERHARDTLERIFKQKAQEDIDRLEFCEEKATLTFRERRKTVIIKLAEY